jgi:serine phosphatase RsbU (regulator of sigma subunit)
LLVLAVVSSALVGLDRISRADRAVQDITQAQRRHQDADMAHDALHADVLRLIAQTMRPPSRLRRLELDATRYRDAIRDVSRSRLPSSLNAQLAPLRVQQLAYIVQAEQLGRLAQSDPAAARRAEPAFEVAFDRLAGPQAAATDAFSGIVSQQMSRADRQREDARNLVVLAALVGVATLVALTIWLARLGTRLAAASRQRVIAETLQRSLLPAQLPSLDGLDIAARYEPVGDGVEIGGDWYNVFPLPSGALGLVMGDVTGHDMAAATVMGQLRTAVQAYALEGHRPSEVLRLANELALRLSATQFATCVYAVLDPDRTALTLANAGHYPPLVVGVDSAARFLDRESPGPPLGAMPDPGYTEARYPLPEGFRLLLFTDGLVERRGVDLDEALQWLAQQADRPSDDLQEFCDSLLAASFDPGAQSDDVALLAVASAAGVDRSSRSMAYSGRAPRES